MLENLTGRLQGVIKNLRGQARLTEDNISDAMREVRMALLEADTALVAMVRLALGDAPPGSFGECLED